MNDSVLLSPAQTAMLRATLRTPHDPPYAIQLVVPLVASAFDPSSDRAQASWKAAWTAVVAEHEILRLRFNDDGAVVAPCSDPPLWNVVSLRQHPASQFEERVKDLCLVDRKRGFRFTGAEPVALCRCIWFEPPPGQDPVWCLTYHHAVLDGNSLRPLIDLMVSHLHNGRLKLKPPPFADTARLIADTDWSDAKAHFLRRANEGAPATDPAVGLAGHAPSPPGHRAPHRVELNLQEVFDDAPQGRAPSSPLRVAALMEAAWALVLGRAADREVVRFGVTRHCRGRARDGLRTALGPYSNVVPLQLRIPHDQPVHRWLKEVAAASANLREFERCPAPELQAALDSIEDEAPLFETLINVTRRPPAHEIAAAFGTLCAGPVQLHAKTDIPLSVIVSVEPTIKATVVALSDRYSLDATQRIGDWLQRALRLLLTDIDRLVGDLSLAPFRSAPDKDTPPRKDESQTAVEYLHRVVQSYPDAVAITTAEREWTFREVWARANDFAKTLRAAGMRQREVVSIPLGRCAETVIAMFGAHIAGGAFFVVRDDQSWAQILDRIRKAGSRFVATSRNTTRSEPGTSELHLIEVSSDGALGRAMTERIEPPKGGDLAYLVATSGTTGTPRLVMVEHRSLANMLAGYADVLQPRPGDVRYQGASVGSDTFVLEVMLYLCFGAALHIEPNLLDHGLGAFDRKLRERNISVLGLPSSLWRKWAQHVQTHPESTDVTPESLRAVVCSMERTDPEALRAWRNGAGRDKLWINAYGPSEAACVTTLFALAPEAEMPNGDLPIGRPLPHTQVYVVDSRLRSLPDGVVGQIAIGGIGVGRGYMNDPGATQTKFVADPFAKEPDARLYLTGDLGYFQDDGELVFVGRMDYQVKVRGHRVELEEVDHCLVRHPGVEDAATVAVVDDEETRLVAFYRASATCDVKTLRTHLAAMLHNAALPHRFVRRDEIPRSAAGKIQRDILTDVARRVLMADARTVETSPMQSDAQLESQLCHLMAQALRVQTLEPGDDFFEHGGDSMRSVALLSSIESQLGRRVSLNTLYAHPSASSLAAHLERRTPAPSHSCLIQMSASGRGNPLFFLHGYAGLSAQLPLVRGLLGARPVWCVHAVEHDGGEPDPCVETMAQRYADAIAELTKGPIILCGYSLGGVLAFETARRARAAGVEVERLIVLDSMLYNLPRLTQLRMELPRTRSQLTSVLRSASESTTLVRKVASHAWEWIRSDVPNAARKWTLPTGIFGPTTSRHIRAYSHDHYSRAVRRYCPTPHPVPICLFYSKLRGNIAVGWKTLTPHPIRTIAVPWDHKMLREPEVAAQLSDLIHRELDRDI